MAEPADSHSTAFTLVSVSPNKAEEVPALRRLRLLQHSERENWSGLALDYVMPPLGLKGLQSEVHNLKTIEYRAELLLKDLVAELGPTEQTVTFAVPNEGQLVREAAPQNTYSKGTYLLTQELLYRVYQTDARLVRSVLELSGFAATDSHDWNILWASSSPKPYLYEGLNEHQRINHFPKSNEITRKDLLCANLVKMQATYGKEHFNFVPDTFILPDEFADFCAEFNADPGSLWIVKPSASSQGRGIFLVDNLVDVPLDDNCIISRYIGNPLLLNTLKFDLRIYVLVTSFDPLRIYVYQEGLTRFASEAYNPNSASNRYMFLTNYSVNKKNTNFVQNESTDKDDVGHKWSLSALSKHLEGVGIDLNLLWGKIYDLIIKTVISIEPVVTATSRKLGLQRGNCFDLFGFDVIIDSNLKPWLLEVNLSPSLATDSPLDLAIKGQLLADTFTLIGIRSYDRKKDGISRARSRLVGNRTFKTSSLPAYGRTSAQPVSEAYSQSARFRVVLKETLEEFEKRGRFLRIFPAPGTDAYNRYFPVMRTANVCLYEALFAGMTTVSSSPKRPPKSSKSPSRTIIREAPKKAEIEPVCSSCGQPYPKGTPPCPTCYSPTPPTRIRVSTDDLLVEYISRLAHILRSIREEVLKVSWRRCLERFLIHQAWRSSDQRRSGESLLWQRLEARVVEIRHRQARLGNSSRPEEEDTRLQALQKLSSSKLETTLRNSLKSQALDLVSCLFDSEGCGLLTVMIRWLADAANRQETRILREAEGAESGEDGESRSLVL